jgi:hypothetical protein
MSLDSPHLLVVIKTAQPWRLASSYILGSTGTAQPCAHTRATDGTRSPTWLQQQIDKAPTAAFAHQKPLKQDFIIRRQQGIFHLPIYSPGNHLFFSLSPRIKRLQRINLAIPAANNLPPLTLNELPASRPGHVQPHKAHILRFPPARQQIVGDVFEMGLYARRVVEGLVVAEVREGFWVLFEL